MARLFIEMNKTDNKVSGKTESTEYRAPKKDYEENFASDTVYRSTLPDVQNAPKDAIRGANVPIMQVGMHNFKLPLKKDRQGHFHIKSGQARTPIPR